MAAELVKKGETVADIGTDHAYLPAYLVQNGICERAIAADVVRGPLKNAEKTVFEYGLTEKIETVLSDGLKNIPLEKITAVVLAGMGGELIRDILSAADAEKLRKIHIIAQPQTHHELLRRYFFENGFEIREEKICLDGGKIYVCMDVYYSGKKDYPRFSEYSGGLKDSSDPLTKAYFEKLRKNFEIKKKNTKDENEKKFLFDLISYLNGLTGGKENET